MTDIVQAAQTAVAATEAALSADKSASIQGVLKMLADASQGDPQLPRSEISPLLKRIAKAKGCKIADVESEFSALLPQQDKPKRAKAEATIEELHEDASIEAAINTQDFLMACVCAHRDGTPFDEMRKAVSDLKDAELMAAFERDAALSARIWPLIQQVKASCERNALAVIMHTDGNLYERVVRDFGDEKVIMHPRISTTIIPVAAGDAPDGGGWVRIFEVRTPRGTVEEVVISQSEFAKGGAWLKKLQDAGALINNPDRTLSALQFVGTPSITRAYSACGWQGDDVYVLPNGDILAARKVEEKPIINFKPLPGYEPIGQSLTAANEAIFKYCVGNPTLVLSTCAALAAPFLRVVNQRGGGFNFHGEPGTGKTLAVRIGTATTASGAAPVDGGAVHSWRGTDNGAEASAKEVCDSVFPRDELHLCKPETADKVIYMLGDGEGKQTLTQKREKRDTFKFVNMVLSTGELSTKAHIESDRKLTYRAGAQARICDIPVRRKDHGGVFQELHGFADAGVMARHFESVLPKHSGWHVRALVQRYLSNRDKVLDILKKRTDTFYSRLVEAHGLSAQDDASRATHRFALAAAVGEIAISLKILPWSKGAAYDGVADCYKAWLTGQGGGNILAVHGIEALETWLTRNSAAFEWMGDKAADLNVEIRSPKLGYRRNGVETTDYGVKCDYTEYILDKPTLVAAIGREERLEAVCSYLRDEHHDKISLIAKHGFQIDAPAGTLKSKRGYMLRVYEVGRVTRERDPKAKQPAVRSPEVEGEGELEPALENDPA